MADPHVISALRGKKQAEVAGLIDNLERLLAQHCADLMHLDGVLRLYQPDRDPEAIRPKPDTRAQPLFRPGRALPPLPRGVQGRAKARYPVAELVAAVIAAKGFDAGDRVLRDRIDDLVESSARADAPIRGSVELIGQEGAACNGSS